MAWKEFYFLIAIPIFSNAKLIGMANPRPCISSPEIFDVIIPITFPGFEIKGPPLFPGMYL